MIKKMIKLSSMTFLMFGCAVAAEFRAPLMTERGPLRYDMHAKKDRWSLDLWSVAYGKEANKSFMKHGVKTDEMTALLFNKNNFKVSDAIATRIGEQAATAAYSEEFNANLGATTLFPRASYSEQGFSLGGRFEYPVFENKGRLGVRAHVPFKTIRVERDNVAETNEQGNQDNYVLVDLKSGVTIPVDNTGGARVAPGAAGDGVVNTGERNVVSNMYRLSFVRDLPFVRAGQVSRYIDLDAAGDMAIGGQSYDKLPAAAANNPDAAVFGGLRYTNIPYAVFYHRNDGTLPSIQSRPIQLGQANAQVHSIRGGAAASAATGAAIGITDSRATARADAALAVAHGGGAGAAGVQAGGVGGAVVATGDHLVDYTISGVVMSAGGAADIVPMERVFFVDNVNGNRSAAAVAGAGPAPAVVAADPNGAAIGLNAALAVGGLQADNLPGRPLTPLTAATALAPDTLYALQGQEDLNALFDRHGDDLWLVSVAANGGDTLLAPGEDNVLQSRINRYGRESAEQWLWRNNYKFDTTQRTGLGDADVDVFYEHTFNPSWRGELALGLRLPLGGKNRTGRNPYNLPLGNGGHWEARGLANLGWKALSWLNLKAEAEVGYAFKATEDIAASFKGGTIKGLGPTQQADIDYGYARGRVEATMYHPKHRELATTVGYELDYKQENKTTFKKAAYTSNTLADDANSWFGGFWDNAAAAFVKKDLTLDSAVSRKNTEQFMHRVRVESSWQALKYMNLFVGGAFTFAGKGAMRESEMNGGVNVKF